MATRSKLGIIGAGAVGVTFAYTLQIMGTVREIVILDLDRDRLDGEVMDLNHGLAFVPPVEISAGEYADLADADIVVLAAGAKQKPGEDRLSLVGRNVAICRDVVGKLCATGFSGIIIVVANPVDILTYVALKESGFAPERVFGSGTVLDSARFRYFLSEQCELDARDVHAYIVGEHGDSEVALWSRANLAGMPFEEHCKICGRCHDKQRRKAISERVRNSAYHIIEAKGATNYAVSLAMERITRAVLRDERSVMTVSRHLEGAYGLHDVCLGLPTVVGAAGAQKVMELDISEKEKSQLQQSSRILKDIIAKVYKGK